MSVDTSSSPSPIQVDSTSSHGDPHDPSARLATVELNGNSVSIRRGSYTGARLKDALDVPRDHMLEQVINGQFKPVESGAHLAIHGGEIFVSHCGQGQSS